MIKRDRATDKEAMKLESHPQSSEVGNGAAREEELQACITQTQNRALKTNRLMERVVESQNWGRALKRVMQNKGAPGVDKMSTSSLPDWLKQNGKQLIKELLAGSYKPKMVRRVVIPKPGGGERNLGIPTVIDRLVQQALLQVLNDAVDSSFSESSYGFRPGKSAHQALLKAQEYVKEGRDIVVDIDIERFFDRVNHDVLMSRISRRIEDKRVLRIIRAFLNAGILHNGVCIIQEEGTPQGGPLSPLLANILLDELDKELEQRGHKFCRYADDCNIYVSSQKAGERVMATLREFLAKRLRLKLNKEKSAVGPSRYSQIPGLYTLNEWSTFDSKTK